MLPSEPHQVSLAHALYRLGNPLPSERHQKLTSCSDSTIEPFVLASQVTQVYYLSYPCVDKPSLRDWWVVYHVAPWDCLPPIDTNNDSTQTEGPTDDISYFQEDGLEGTFVINLGGDFEIITSGASDEITDPKELEELEKQSVGPQQEGTLESDEEGDEDDAESYDEDCYEEEDF